MGHEINVVKTYPLLLSTSSFGDHIPLWSILNQKKILFIFLHNFHSQSFFILDENTPRYKPKHQGDNLPY